MEKNSSQNPKLTRLLLQRKKTLSFLKLQSYQLRNPNTRRTNSLSFFNFPILRNFKDKLGNINLIDTTSYLNDSLSEPHRDMRRDVVRMRDLKKSKKVIFTKIHEFKTPDATQDTKVLQTILNKYYLIENRMLSLFSNLKNKIM